MAAWFWYAALAAVLYGTHQVFTRLASEHIGDGVGGFVVEGVATLTILGYLGLLWFSGRWEQKFSWAGFNYSVLTGICVGAGTVAFFLFVSTRRSALSRACHSRGWCRYHGCSGHCVFSGACVMAAFAWCRARNRGLVFSSAVAL